MYHYVACHSVKTTTQNKQENCVIYSYLFSVFIYFLLTYFVKNKFCCVLLLICGPTANRIPHFSAEKKTEPQDETLYHTRIKTESTKEHLSINLGQKTA